MIDANVGVHKVSRIDRTNCGSVSKFSTLSLVHCPFTVREEGYYSVCTQQVVLDCVNHCVMYMNYVTVWREELHVFQNLYCISSFAALDRDLWAIIWR